MAQYNLTINQTTHTIDVDPETPLLWILRDTLGLVGTKYGCGIAQCGACTVQIDGVPMRSCSLPIGQVEGKVTTIEGLSPDSTHPVQVAWRKHDVPQCGYCQAGQMMTAAALIADNKNPTESEIRIAMHGNLCRCGTYQRITQAVKTAAKIS